MEIQLLHLTVSTQDATGFATIWAKVVQADGYILPIVESDLTGRTVTAGLENEMVEATAVVVEENFTVELSTTASMVDEGESIRSETDTIYSSEKCNFNKD